jgi:16S rRNA (guanine1207-N2)-methyltransferase
MSYFQLKSLEGGAFTKPGVPGYSQLEPAQVLLLEALQNMNLQGFSSAVDLSARGGAVALALQTRGLSVSATDSSAAALSCLAQTGLSQVLPDQADLVCAILNGERGNARVFHTINTVWTQTRAGGSVLLAGDKDKGFERYFKRALEIFGDGEIILRGKGFRVARLEKTNLETPTALEPEHFTIEVRGRALACVAHPGAFASGKLDAASALLLEHLPSGADRNVLDIGAGYGALAGFLGLEGATITTLEDDALSVVSITDTMRSNELKARVLHSDVDQALEPTAKFDLIVMNPPFHVGKALRLDVALEFIHAAGRHLANGGEVWLVANHFLPYEEPMRALGKMQEVARAKGFKVLKVG